MGIPFSATGGNRNPPPAPKEAVFPSFNRARDRPRVPPDRGNSLKKAALLLLLATAALILDGTLTYDILDFRRETWYGWFMLFLVLLIGVILIVADHSKKDGNEDTSG